MYHSRYFYRPVREPRCLGSFCVAPRIFAYQDEKGPSGNWLDRNDFFISFRVTDTSVALDDDAYLQTPDEQARLADLLVARAGALFRVDSLTLLQLPQGAPLTERPDSADHRPRAANYLTYRFGQVAIPPAVTALRAVLYVTRFEGEAARPDSLVFEMDRFEYHGKGLPLGRENIRGYED